jgi:hypothetical protein
MNAAYPTVDAVQTDRIGSPRDDFPTRFGELKRPRREPIQPLVWKRHWEISTVL